MTMQSETKSRKAFEFVVDALRDIDVYRDSKDPEQLRLAESKLGQAMREDPNYLRPHYYLGILYDLMGKSDDAVSLFEKLPEKDLPFQDEFHYNLGLAYYHGYNWPKLDKAIEHFTVLINKTKNRGLKLLAKASLAQCYAMHMIPPVDLLPSEPGKVNAALIERINGYFTYVERLYGEVTEEISKARKTGEEEISKATLAEAEWSIYNARAMAHMYSTDYVGRPEERIRRLQEALRELEIAKGITGENWANHCDLGSCHMRLGHYRRSEEDFEKAREYLQTVVERLRPRYGFALYEMGRTYRLQSHFDTAKEYCTQSLAIPRRYRDVSDERVAREIRLAEGRSTMFP